MNSRQKFGVSMAISGGVTLGLGIVIGATMSTPAWVDVVLKVIPVVLQFFGLVVNLPTNTNPK